MRILKWVLGIVLALVVVFVVGGFLLPREVSVARSITIDAPPEEVFPHLNSLKAFNDWSPWTGRDPDMVPEFSGPDEGVGAVMAWESEQRDVGSGKQEITASVPDERVETALDFGDMGTAEAAFDLVPVDGGTEVTWSFTGDMGSNPVGRWMGLMMDSWVGGDYETGLGNLKARVEGV